jgi:hypothetical protein
MKTITLVGLFLAVSAAAVGAWFVAKPISVGDLYDLEPAQVLNIQGKNITSSQGNGQVGRFTPGNPGDVLVVVVKSFNGIQIIYYTFVYGLNLNGKVVKIANSITFLDSISGKFTSNFTKVDTLQNGEATNLYFTNGKQKIIGKLLINGDNFYVEGKTDTGVIGQVGYNYKDAKSVGLE